MSSFNREDHSRKSVVGSTGLPYLRIQNVFNFMQFLRNVDKNMGSLRVGVPPTGNTGSASINCYSACGNSFVETEREIDDMGIKGSVADHEMRNINRLAS